MIIGSIKETPSLETRTALTPKTTYELNSLGHTILLEKDIGKKSYFNNKDYLKSKAIFCSKSQIYQKSNIIIQITPPPQKYLNLLSSKQILISNFTHNEHLLSKTKATIIRLEKVPRTSNLQSIDTLSSQALTRGYNACLYALSQSPTIAPLLFTPATSLPKSKALIFGASITGLEIASMLKKNGANTSIIDTSTKQAELVHSVGAKFIHLHPSTNLSSILNDKDFIISAITSHTLKHPPILTTKDLKSLKSPSLLIDTTFSNIPIKSNFSQTSTYIFHRNPYFERLTPQTSSILFANNILNLIKLITPTSINTTDLSAISTMLHT